MSELSPLANADALLELSTLRDEKCSLVTASYGNELVLGFGPTHLGDWPLRETRMASWMLHTRATPWVLETSHGVVATDRRRLGPKALRQVEEAVLNVAVMNAEVRNNALALTLYFANKAQLSLLPSADEVRRKDTSVEVWELFMPGSQLLRATADGELQLLRADQVPSESGDDGEPMSSSVDAVSSVLAREARARKSKIVAFRRVLREAVGSLGYELFEPSVKQDTGVDAVVVGPEGKVVLIEHKRRLTDGHRSIIAQYVDHVAALLIITDEPSDDKESDRFIANARRRGLKVAHVSWIDDETGEIAAGLESLMAS